MNQFYTLCVLLVIGMTGAMIIPKDDVKNVMTDEKVHFDVNDGGQLTEENIEMNYEEKYVRVSTPAMGNLQAMVLIHDYSKGLTLFKVNGSCYLMDQYNDIPKKMEDWYKLKLNMKDGLVQAGGENGYRAHHYKDLPFSLDRSVLPLVMQNECEEISMLVLQETVQGVQAYDELQSGDKVMGIVYLPAVCTGQNPFGNDEMSSRTKRRAAVDCDGCNGCVIVKVEKPKCCQLEAAGPVDELALN